MNNKERAKDFIANLRCNWASMERDFMTELLRLRFDEVRADERERFESRKQATGNNIAIAEEENKDLRARIVELEDAINLLWSAVKDKP